MNVLLRLPARGQVESFPMTVDGLMLYNLLYNTPEAWPIVKNKNSDIRPYFRKGRDSHFNPYIDALIVTVSLRVEGVENLNLDETVRRVVNYHMCKRGWSELGERALNGYMHRRRRLKCRARAYIGEPPSPGRYGREFYTGEFIGDQKAKFEGIEPYLLSVEDIYGILESACKDEEWYQDLDWEIRALLVYNGQEGETLPPAKVVVEQWKMQEAQRLAQERQMPEEQRPEPEPWPLPDVEDEMEDGFLEPFPIDIAGKSFEEAIEDLGLNSMRQQHEYVNLDDQGMGPVLPQSNALPPQVYPLLHRQSSLNFDFNNMEDLARGSFEQAHRVTYRDHEQPKQWIETVRAGEDYEDPEGALKRRESDGDAKEVPHRDTGPYDAMSDDEGTNHIDAARENDMKPAEEEDEGSGMEVGSDYDDL